MGIKKYFLILSALCFLFASYTNQEHTHNCTHHENHEVHDQHIGNQHHHQEDPSNSKQVCLCDTCNIFVDFYTLYQHHIFVFFAFIKLLLFIKKEDILQSRSFFYYFSRAPPLL